MIRRLLLGAAGALLALCAREGALALGGARRGWETAEVPPWAVLDVHRQPRAVGPARAPAQKNH